MSRRNNHTNQTRSSTVYAPTCGNRGRRGLNDRGVGTDMLVGGLKLVVSHNPAVQLALSARLAKGA